MWGHRCLSDAKEFQPRTSLGWVRTTDCQNKHMSKHENVGGPKQPTSAVFQQRTERPATTTFCCRVQLTVSERERPLIAYLAIR